MPDIITKRNEMIAKAGCIALAAAAVTYIYFAHDVRLKYFIMGSGSWGFGVMLKILLHAVVMKRLSKDALSTQKAALLNGLISGVTELGLAAIFFVYLGELTLWQVIAFGTGIGAIEAWVVATTPNLLKGTVLEEGMNTVEAAIRQLPVVERFWWEGIAPIYERLCALLVHIGTRGLLYVTCRTLSPFPALFSLAAFVLLDGVLAFKVLMQPTGDHVRRLRWFYLWFSVTAVALLVLFALFWTTLS